MKIAIPTTNGTTIAAHFGRSPSFLILDIEGGRIVGREIRPNEGAPAACQGHGGGRHGGQHEARHGRHHHRIVQRLQDCQAIVGRGMGAGARQALESAGISVHTVQAPCTPEEGAMRLASGQLRESQVGCPKDDPSH